jgi:predicted 2-oxoglutarate/Fe(II)-dependent dioxygenase YbiX
MEVKKLEDYVKIFHNFLPNDIFKNLHKICKNTKKFEQATIIHNGKNFVEDKKIRQTQVWHLKNLESKSLTEVHWANFLQNTFVKAIEKYLTNFQNHHSFEICEIQILKYNLGGHYKFHTDSHATIPRTYSCIFLINDDYEGGDLVFKYPDFDKEYTINKQKNTMIVWPSNFLYPHSVKPVTKGERYSVVSWAV